MGCPVKVEEDEAVRARHEDVPQMEVPMIDTRLLQPPHELGKSHGGPHSLPSFARLEILQKAHRIFLKEGDEVQPPEDEQFLDHRGKRGRRRENPFPGDTA